MKKAQITLFLLIPLILLAAFLLVFAFAKALNNSQASSQSDLLLSDTAQKENLNRYIEECISSTTEEAIQTIASQGGFFFQNQSGSIIDWEIPYILLTNKENQEMVAYQIYLPSSKQVSQDYLYPCYTELAYVLQ